MATREEKIRRLKELRLQELRSQDNIVEEMHPDISTLDRAAVKNLSNATAEAAPQNLEFLRQKYPDLQIEDRNGRVVAKRPDETEWRVLDPNTGFFSSDFARDALDVAAPALQGAVESGADLLGAAVGAPLGMVAGSPAGPPGMVTGGAAGAVAGRALAGGAAAGLTETLRQQLGKRLGVNPEVNPEDVKASAALSAAFPLAGTALKGLYRGTTRTALPYLAEQLSGVPREVIRYAGRNMDKIDALDERGVADQTLGLVERIQNTLRGGIEGKGKELFQRIQDAKGMVNIEEAKATIPKIISDYESLRKELDNRALDDAVNELRRQYDELFMRSEPKAVQGLISQAKSPEEAQQIIKTLNPKEQVRASSIIDPATGKAAQVTELVADEIPNELTPLSAWMLQRQIGYANDAAKLSGMPLLNSTRTAGKSDAGKRLVGALDDSYDSIGNELERVTTETIPEQVTTRPKTVMEMVSSPWETMRGNTTVSETVAPKTSSSATLKKEYQDIRDAARTVDEYFPTPERAYTAFTNMTKKGKRIFNDRLRQIREKYGIDLKDDLDLMNAHDYFGERYSVLPNIPVAGRGGTTTTRTLGSLAIGGTIGALSGNYGDSDETGGGISGRNMILGATALGAIANPFTLKRGLRGGRAMERIGAALNPGGVLTNYAPRTAWRLMNQNSPSESQLYPSGWLGFGQ